MKGMPVPDRGEIDRRDQQPTSRVRSDLDFRCLSGANAERQIVASRPVNAGHHSVLAFGQFNPKLFAEFQKAGLLLVHDDPVSPQPICILPTPSDNESSSGHLRANVELCRTRVRLGPIAPAGESSPHLRVGTHAQSVCCDARPPADLRRLSRRADVELRPANQRSFRSATEAE